MKVRRFAVVDHNPHFFDFTCVCVGAFTAFHHTHETRLQAKVEAWVFCRHYRRITLTCRPCRDTRPFTVAPNVVPVGLVVVIPQPVQRCYVLTESGRAVASEARV